jgi:biopolymer transport protein ExbD
VATNGNKTSLDGFQKAMEKAVAGKEDKVVVAMSCDDGVPMGMVFKVHRHLREMGLMKMSYVTSAGNNLTLALPPFDYEKRLNEIAKEHISTLALKGGGVMLLDGESLKTVQLGDEVKKLFTLDDKHILSIKISEEATYGDFVTVLGIAKSADATRILINDPTG